MGMSTERVKEVYDIVFKALLAHSIMVIEELYARREKVKTSFETMWDYTERTRRLAAAGEYTAADAMREAPEIAPSLTPPFEMNSLIAGLANNFNQLLITLSPGGESGKVLVEMSKHLSGARVGERQGAIILDMIKEKGVTLEEVNEIMGIGAAARTGAPKGKSMEDFLNELRRG